jgi:iron(III) transport system permease protein
LIHRLPEALRGGWGTTPWTLASGIILLLVLAPLASLAVAASDGSPDLWQHLVAYVLPDATRDTLLLLAGVGVLAGSVGTAAAWLVSAYDFPARRVLDWALLLPLAVPTYIVAYAYLDVLHPVGPVQTALRAVLGFESPREFRLPDVRSMTGCVILLGFVLYPYVYLTTRAMFQMQAANVVDTARTLGAGRVAVFFRVALPLARPAVAIGVSLALMEALNDIGASEFLGVRTLTVSIYSTWSTRSDLAGAAQIALALLAFVMALVLLERAARQQRRYANDAQHPRPLTRHRLDGARGWALTVAVFVPILVGFVVPAAYLVHATALRLQFAGISPAVVRETVNTIVLSLVATAITLGCGLVVAYASRLSRHRTVHAWTRLAGVGYAVPGTVLAIGLLPVVTGLDLVIDRVATTILGVSTGLLLLGSGAALVYAYGVRFLAVAAGGIEAGLSRISTSLDDAGRTMGEGTQGRLRRIHMPLTRPALAAAGLLVFVDCMKELPATLLLRPLGFETLATHLYGEAVRGTYEDAAVVALLIVMAGLVPVLVLSRVSRGEQAGTPSSAAWL